MKRFTHTLALAALAMSATSAWAQKEMYIPQEWRNRTDTLIWSETDENNEYTWSKSRSVESDNVIVLWDKGYGSTNPSNASSTYKVDVDDLLAKCEEFYQLECDSLGFVDPETSNLSKYKVMVLLNHSSEWICYGGGYDYQVPALWLSPSTCKPVGSSVAHEVGHSFHYMCYSEDSNHGTTSGIETGFHSAVGNGSVTWETTANWQALQSYPDEMFTESYHHIIYPNTHCYALTHEWHRYQAYMFYYFLCDHFGSIRTIADIWNTRETTVKDFNQVLRDCKDLSVSELYDLYFQYALHAVTWDLDAWEPYRTSSYIGNYNYFCVQDGQRSYQVAYASAPQSTGFNVIPLDVPDAGTEVSIDFTALTSGAALLEGDPALYYDGDSQWAESGATKYNSTSAMRNFRLGYVALMQDGTTQYFYEDSLYCHGKSKMTETVAMTVPENTKKLWFVVSPAPGTYVQHKWDESISNDDQWPYKFAITGTDLSSTNTTVYESYMIGDRGVADITLVYDLYMEPMTTTDATTITISDEALLSLGTALQMEGDEIASHIVDYSEEGPQVGEIMVYPYSSTGDLVDQASGVDGAYGYWYTKRSALTTADSSTAALCATFDPSTLSFSISQTPSALSAGNVVSARIALRYRYSEDVEAIAKFQIRVNVNENKVGYSLSSVTYDEEAALPVESVLTDPDIKDGLYHDLSGRAYSAPTVPGIYIKDGKKVIVK